MSEGSAILGEGRAAEEAASWFARLQGGAATGEDWLAFERWLQAAPVHARAYEDLERLWVDLDNAPIIRDLGVRPAPLALRAANANRRAWIGGGVALAAGLAIAVVGVGLPPASFLGKGAAAGQTFATAPGQTRQVTLADGTRIRLNAASKITIKLGRDARRVEMADAEATFDVAHDARRPFLITVGDRQVSGGRHRVQRASPRGPDRGAHRACAASSRSAPPTASTPDPTRVAVGQQLAHVEGQPLQSVSTAGAGRRLRLDQWPADLAIRN